MNIMTEAMTLISAWIAGLLLGMVFFGGLWWTIQHGMHSPRPALWFLGSLVARMSIVVAGFALVFHGHWERLLACLCGFIIARWILVRIAVRTVHPSPGSVKDTRHAS
jgi:F1F0 ATPase subunit 2